MPSRVRPRPTLQRHSSRPTDNRATLSPERRCSAIKRPASMHRRRASPDRFPAIACVRGSFVRPTRSYGGSRKVEREGQCRPGRRSSLPRPRQDLRADAAAHVVRSSPTAKRPAALVKVPARSSGLKIASRSLSQAHQANTVNGSRLITASRQRCGPYCCQKDAPVSLILSTDMTYLCRARSMYEINDRSLATKIQTHNLAFSSIRQAKFPVAGRARAYGRTASQLPLDCSVGRHPAGR